MRKYPTYNNLDYELLLETENINKFFKIIGVKKNKNLKEMKAFIKGNINLNAQKYYFNKVVINNKNLEKKKLIKLKKYFDRNSTRFLNGQLKKKSSYQLIKDLIEFI